MPDINLSVSMYIIASILAFGFIITFPVILYLSGKEEKQCPLKECIKKSDCNDRCIMNYKDKVK